MFSKPNSKAIQDSAAGVVGAIAGGVASNYVVDAIAPINNAGTPEDLTKSKNMNLYASIGVVVLSVIGAASTKGNDTQAQAIKGSFLGMAVTQGVKVAGTLLDSKVSNTKARTALGLTGLGCGCNSVSYPATPMLQYPRSTKPSYKRASLRGASNTIVKERFTISA